MKSYRKAQDINRAAAGREKGEQCIDNLTIINCSHIYGLPSTHAALNCHYFNSLILINAHLILPTTVVIPNLRTRPWVRHVLLRGWRRSLPPLLHGTGKLRVPGQVWCSCSETSGFFYPFLKPLKWGFSPSGCWGCTFATMEELSDLKITRF